MKTKKVLPLILLLFVAIMLFSVGMIAKEYRERQQDIKGFEKLEDIITEVEQTEMTDNVEQTETPQEQKQSTRNLTPLFEANRDCIGWIYIPNTAVNYPVMFTPKEPQKYLRKNFEGEWTGLTSLSSQIRRSKWIRKVSQFPKWQRCLVWERRIHIG